MAQKKKKNRKQGHPGRQQQNHGTKQGISTAQAAVERAMDQVTPEFLRWYEATQEDDGLGMPLQLIMRNIFTVVASSDARVSVTDFDPRAFAEVFETIVNVEREFGESSEDADAVNLVINAVATYVDFLDESGRWGGTREDLALLKSLAEQVMNGVALDDEDSMDLSSMEELAVGNLNEMKVVEVGRELVRWIGEGRAVEPGGELAADQAGEAAERVAARLALPASTPEQLLMRVYVSLALAEVIELEDTQVVPSAGAEDFLSEDPSMAFGSLFSFVHAFLEESLVPPELGDDAAMEAWELLCETLDAATVGTPMVVGQPAPEGVAPKTWQSVIDQLDEFAELGLVNKDAHYDVPLAVGALLEELFEDDEDLEHVDELSEEGWDPNLFDTPGEAGAASNVIQLPAAEGDATGSVLQLKLGLKHARPPIWRRVLVKESSSLTDLHEVIQVSFRWNDAHMHAFNLKPGQARDLPLRDGEVDEGAVSIGQLLATEKDKIGYTYDFGDDWQLEVILEKILDDEQGAVPRCTGGRRMAPMEDSGGIYGWELMLASIKDPGHEMHAEHREWLGLEDGEELDDSVFDLDRVNRSLGYLA